MKTDHTPPTYQAARFNCPHCGAFSAHEWNRLYIIERAARQGVPIYTSVCQSCDRWTLWISETEKMVFPRIVSAPLPSPDMPKEAREFYKEAGLVFDDSPRAAAALLRLALEKLLESQEIPGDTLNQQIGNLVKERKLPLSVQKSLDAVRVIGNDAIHDLGQIQLDDDRETAGMLFGLINFAVEKLITDPETVNGIYEMLPESKRKAIEERDNPQ